MLEMRRIGTVFNGYTSNLQLLVQFFKITFDKADMI